MSASHKLVYLWQIEQFDQCNYADWIESSIFGNTYPLNGYKWVIQMLPSNLTLNVLLDGEHSDKVRVKYTVSIVDKDTEKIHSVRADNFIEGDDNKTGIHYAWSIPLVKSDFKTSSFLFGGTLAILFELELQIDSSLNESVQKSEKACEQMWSKSIVRSFSPIQITAYTDTLIAPNMEQISKADYKYGANRGFKCKTNLFVDDKSSPQTCEILIELRFNPLSELRPTKCTNVFCTLKDKNDNQLARFTCQQIESSEESLTFASSRIPFIGDVHYDIAIDVEPECLIITPMTSIFRDCTTPREKILCDYKNVFDSPIFGDVVTLRMGDDTIQVHKAILMARSPFFAKLFNSELHDVITGIVTVADTDTSTMRTIVTYFYTGMTDNIGTKEAENLLKAANQYGLDILKHKCEQILCDNINMMNVGRFLILAQEFDAPSLENSAFAFIRTQY